MEAALQQQYHCCATMAEFVDDLEQRIDGLAVVVADQQAQEGPSLSVEEHAPIEIGAKQQHDDTAPRSPAACTAPPLHDQLKTALERVPCRSVPITSWQQPSSSAPAAAAAGRFAKHESEERRNKCAMLRKQLRLLAKKKSLRVGGSPDGESLYC